MEPATSIFNWSLKKILLTESNSFERAKARILYIVLVLSLAKILIALAVSWYFDQTYQFGRAVTILLVYTSLLKILLIDKKFLKPITHVMIILGLLLIYSNIFFHVQGVNVLTMQFIFMLILSTFYLLDFKFSFFYSFLATSPVILHMVLKNHVIFNLAPPEELASPGYELIVILNFFTIIVGHYLFRDAFVANIAEKEALNARLQLAVNEANQAAASKSEFLSTMSHELRTPLNSVIGISELLLLDTHTPDQEENLNILKFSASNLHTLINDILDFNKLGSGKLELECVSVDLEAHFKDLSKGLRFQAVQKGIEFILDVDTALKGSHVITDPTRLSQIIYNLAGNAIKFTETGSVKVSLKLLDEDDQRSKIGIMIADTGIGINLEKQEAIFEPFTQASSSTTRNFGGTGLGLAIVKKLLNLFNSEIRLESKPDVGSVFSFDLVLPRDLSFSNLANSAVEQEFDLKGLKILVAEDNPMNRILLIKIFSKWNCQPVFAMNGQEAVDKVISDDFSVVLMDLHMPVMDGYEASRTIRELPNPSKAGIKIIALTASVSGDLSEKIKAVGMDAFVLKPFKLADLYEKLKDLPLSV